MRGDLHKAFDLYSAYDVRLYKSKARRDALKAQGLCLNGAGHGPATHGVRCQHCYETHRRSA